ncbi:MAG: hypothetical protein KF888_05165 [Nitrosomonas sp.]|nr:hypothetical protein [Nitrosomonas sp.]
MNAYQLLYSVTVEHMYFAGKICKSLKFVPTPATSRLLNRTDLLLRIIDNRLSVFFASEQLDILRLCAEDDLIFTFKVFSHDENFSYYTQPDIQPGHTILYFDNQKLNQDQAGRFLLHAEPQVSSGDFVDLESDLIRDDLDPKDRHIQPYFIIKIILRKDTPLLTLSRENVQLREFYIAFASNHSFWKYYLMDSLSGRSLYISDLDDTIEFEDAGNIVFPGNRSARMLQSTRAIPMYEQPAQRLQLKEVFDSRDRVLIKRLPNASIMQISTEPVKGKMENISEIYIH